MTAELVIDHCLDIVTQLSDGNNLSLLRAIFDVNKERGQHRVTGDENTDDTLFSILFEGIASQGRHADLTSTDLLLLVSFDHDIRQVIGAPRLLATSWRPHRSMSECSSLQRPTKMHSEIVRGTRLSRESF